MDSQIPLASLAHVAQIMHRRTLRSRCVAMVRTVIPAMFVALTACHGLLDVSDPTLIQDKDIANAGGANSRRIDLAASFDANFPKAVADVALFTDERTLDRNAQQLFNGNDALDRRDSEGYERVTLGQSDPHLGNLDDIVTRAAIAIAAVHAYSPDSVRGDYLAQLFVLRGFAILQMAEDICSGFPINDVNPNNLPIYGPPSPTDSAVVYAIAHFDSALAFGRDSTRFLDLARVAKGRALLDLGRYAEAAAAVSSVPTDFVYATDPEISNPLFSCATCWRISARMAVGNGEGGTGILFVSAHDPRVPTVFKAVRFARASDSLYDQLKYSTVFTPTIVASGIEARLIEAEAALQAGDSQWIAILDTLRTTAISPAMPVIDPVPSTTAAQVDLLYRERAFWLYLTGRRLGDSRRLIARYGRDPESVFPTGTYPLGGVYTEATAIPFVFANEARVNPRITTGCAVR